MPGSPCILHAVLVRVLPDPVTDRDLRDDEAVKSSVRFLSPSFFRPEEAASQADESLV